MQEIEVIRRELELVAYFVAHTFYVTAGLIQPSSGPGFDDQPCRPPTIRDLDLSVSEVLRLWVRACDCLLLLPY